MNKKLDSFFSSQWNFKVNYDDERKKRILSKILYCALAKVIHANFFLKQEIPADDEPAAQMYGQRNLLVPCLWIYFITGLLRQR